jgi:adenylyltransferase/sulfurtransferase
MRYERQLLISQIGQEGQKKLEQSTVTVVGTGGLGSPVLTYLTSAGVGKIQILIVMLFRNQT